MLDAVVAHTREAPLARELVDAWPMLVPGTHRLEFEGGRVVLTLVFGDALEVFPKLWMRADAIYLDGFAPAMRLRQTTTGNSEMPLTLPALT